MSEQNHQPVDIAEQISLSLTETRVVLPGTQALLGFQFAAVLTETFRGLDGLLKVVHLCSLLTVTLAVIALITPSAYHRLGQRGHENQRVLRMASSMLLVGMALLGLGLASDLYVVARLAIGQGALWLAGLALVLPFAAWFGYPLAERAARDRFHPG